ncbi:pyridoxal phosphate-dependent aminotransferase [Burkholderia sp. S-53]|uniref:pyridoxal phosphate-dependent aminotransferase n=1 Tax=Burkholderia sp. S-53 TaxID=2906514 RepID=UPI0021D09456|nr:aminotransferase class I/II-fold pyridoxal phosphate-dependent enzyme [Burkholderia sp. S-53]UXU85563.1 aminotransferase class I/II-fold pyridoxal phosphate-dependent enzyme [Burkholderia sp. S-53]
MPLPGPFRSPSPASITLDHNLTPQSGPWVAYPDVLQRDLVDGIIRLWMQIEAQKGGALRIVPENVLLTQGGVDALDVALSTFCEPGVDTVGITPPSFEAFPHWAALHGLPVVRLPQEAWGAAAASGTKALLLCSPNNPLGNMIGRDSLRTLLSTYPGIVILDEAYADFSATPSSMSLVDEFDNLVVLRTLSKSFGLAGLRVGALVGHPSTIRAALRVQIPFCVPSPVRAALLEALQEPARVHEAIAHVRRERARMTACLGTSPHVASVNPSDANFLCVHWKDPETARGRLGEAGIRVRDFGAFSRVTIGSHEDNDAFLTTVEASLKGAV